MARIDRLLDDVLSRSGTAIHLTPGHAPMVRTSRGIESAQVDAVDSDAIEAMVREIIPSESRGQLGTSDIAFVHEHRQSSRFHAHVFTSTAGVEAVLRVLPAKPPSLDDLGQGLDRVALRPNGVVFVVGAESDTAAAVAGMLDHAGRTRTCHIVTLEAPIAYVLAPRGGPITQRQIGALGAHCTSYARGLRDARRQDANIVALGQLPDAETAKLALDLGRTALVLARVVASRATSAIELVVSVAPSREQAALRAQISDTLTAVVLTQRARGRACDVLVIGPDLAAKIRAGAPID